MRPFFCGRSKHVHAVMLPNYGAYCHSLNRASEFSSPPHILSSSISLRIVYASFFSDSAGLFFLAIRWASIIAATGDDRIQQVSPPPAEVFFWLDFERSCAPPPLLDSTGVERQRHSGGDPSVFVFEFFFVCK